LRLEKARGINHSHIIYDLHFYNTFFMLNVIIRLFLMHKSRLLTYNERRLFHDKNAIRTNTIFHKLSVSLFIVTVDIYLLL